MPTTNNLSALYVILENQNNKQIKTMAISHLTKQEFVERLHDVDTAPTTWTAKHSLPVLIDFYATWCPPCKALAPLLEELQEEYKGRLKIYKVDVDQEEELTALYNVRTVPTLLFAHPSDTKPTTMLGVMGIAELRQHIENLLMK